MTDDGTRGPGTLGAVSDQSTSRDTAELVDLVYGFMRRVWEHAERRLAPHSLTLKHSFALHALEEPMAMNVLGERLGVDASYVTTLADQLEDRGLIERRPHPGDRRIKSLALTAEGRRFREQLARELWTDVPFLDALTAADREELRRILSRSVDAG
jgi:DNA-binding MarR family transcriptional regulator